MTMCKIIKTDLEKLTVTVEVNWFDLDSFIDKYDIYAGQALRDNDLEKAMMWSEKAKQFRDTREKLSDSIK